MQKIYKDYLKNYWRNIDKNILTGLIILFFLGLFFSFSSTSFLAGERLNKDYYFFFSKHLLFVVVSLILMFLFSLIEISILKKIILPIFIVTLTLLILVPIVGVEVKGAQRWLNLYFLRLQPIELLKPFFILMTAKILSKNDQKSSYLPYALSFLLLMIVILLLINQPDVGQSILIIGAWIATVFISGISIIYIVFFFISFILFLTLLLIIFPLKFGYIINRLSNFFDADKGDGFQSIKALDAIKEGGLKGQGMGEGILKDRVPEAHTDYIIAVISEEFGSIISITIIFIFLYIAFRIVKTSIKIKDKYIKISLCGLTSLLIFQTFIHIGVNTSLLPTTGMTLPFLSYGGSSLIGSALLAGIILNFTKNRYNENE